MDDEWVASYVEHGRTVLKNAYNKIASGLTAVRLPVQEASGGMFVWTDMVELLPEWSWGPPVRRYTRTEPARPQWSWGPPCVRRLRQG
mmetsp:Transcript_40708/g.95154  ORF Transcript_40708/g.95154 Transcript_40708/m.95154 type:complete len:88 (-) Transcript_40708:4-267(-)